MYKFVNDNETIAQAKKFAGLEYYFFNYLVK